MPRIYKNRLRLELCRRFRWKNSQHSSKLFSRLRRAPVWTQSRRRFLTPNVGHRSTPLTITTLVILSYIVLAIGAYGLCLSSWIERSWIQL